MNAAAKSSATERGGRSKGKGKRKLADPDTDRKAPLRQHKPITEHFSSSQDTFEADNVPCSSLKRSKRDHSPVTPNRHLSKAASTSLANMYSFPSSRPRLNGANGVIDLTGPSPPISPQSRMRNKSFAAQDRPVAFAPYQGPKKLVVKNLRTAPRSDPEQYFEKVWGQLDISLTAIFKSYTGEQKMCAGRVKLRKHTSVCGKGVQCTCHRT
jgi:hypothetical protein